jgi:hypothetical protein
MYDYAKDGNGAHHTGNAGGHMTDSRDDAGNGPDRPLPDDDALVGRLRTLKWPEPPDGARERGWAAIEKRMRVITGDTEPDE